MRALAVGVAFALTVPALGLAAEIDRTLPAGGPTDIRVNIVNAQLSSDADGRSLTIVADPARALTPREAQAAAERLFDDYAMASAARRGIRKVSIYVTPMSLKPTPREIRQRTSNFVEHRTDAWSLTNRSPRLSESSFTRRLSDGTRLRVERSGLVYERLDGVVMPTLRAEILLRGLNPMLEREDIYTALRSAWSDVFRQQAAEKGVRSVELIAHVDARSARYELRDETMLQLVASEDGTFPPLPVLPAGELRMPSLKSPAGAGGHPEARFGNLDVTRFDQILDSGFAGLTLPQVQSAPLALLSP